MDKGRSDKMNHDYLEQYAWQIIGPYDMETIKPLAERIDVEGWIAYFHEEREALYEELQQREEQAE